MEGGCVAGWRSIMLHRWKLRLGRLRIRGTRWPRWRRRWITSDLSWLPRRRPTSAPQATPWKIWWNDWKHSSPRKRNSSRLFFYLISLLVLWSFLVCDIIGSNIEWLVLLSCKSTQIHFGGMRKCCPWLAFFHPVILCLSTPKMCLTGGFGAVNSPFKWV